MMDNSMSPADFAAMTNGNGWGDNNGWWLILLFLFAFNGWGNGFGGYGNGGAGADLQRGFDQSATMGALGTLQNTVNTGFSSAEVAGCNRAMDAMQTAYTNQIADLQRSFDAQSAITSHLTGIEGALQNCCCENRASIADLKYTVATEACADRAAVSNGVRDIIANQTASTQAILDKLCQQEIDALKERNQDLRTQLNMANLASSQTAQTARILADNAMQTQALEQYLNPAPIPAYMVQNPNCCSAQSYGCGCGCGVA